MFGLHRRTGDDDPIKAQASWQIEHGADRRDMTPAQDRRYHEFSVMVNAGLDVAHVGFARYLIEHGEVTDD